MGRATAGVLWRQVKALAVVFLAVATSALASAPQPADDAPPAQKTRTDLDGLPLPAEALARMGSGRLRHGYFFFWLGFLPDGSALASGGDGSLRLWDPATGKLKRRFEGPTGWTNAFACGGGRFTAAHADSDTKRVSVEIIDLATEQVIRRGTFPEPASYFHLELTADGKRIAFKVENALRVYDVDTGREKQRVPLRDRICTFTFAPDGRMIAVGESGGSVCLYRTADGRLVRELKREGDQNVRVVFSPDGRFLASMPIKDKQPGEVSLWDVATGKELHRLAVPGKSIYLAAFSPDGRCVATPCQQADLILWDVATGREVRRFQSSSGYGRLAISPDGKILAAGTNLGVIGLWDVATGKKLPASGDSRIGYIRSLRFGADGCLRGRSTSALWFAWDPATGRELDRFPQLPQASWHATLSPDESLLADADAKGVISLRDAKTGRDVRTLPGHTRETYAVLFTPDGSRLISSSQDGTIRVWDVATGKEQLRLAGPGDRAMTLAVSPDGRWLASLDDNLTRQNGYEVILWDLTAGREKVRLAVAGRVLDLAFSPDSRSLVATGGRDTARGSPGQITVWDVPTGKPARAILVDKGWPGNLAFSPDGRTLATGDAHGSLILWELRTGRRRHGFTGHESWIAALAFSPDGRRLAASSAEAPVYVWDVAGDFPRRMSAAEMDRAWKELAGADAVAAFRAVRQLAAVSASAVPFLRERLKPAAAVAPKRVRELVGLLDSPKFADRDRARMALEELAPRAEALLRGEMHQAASLEVRRRLGQVLDRLEAGPPEVLRGVRAVEALEWMGTPAAKRLLDELAGGAAGAVLTREAATSRAR